MKTQYHIHARKAPAGADPFRPDTVCGRTAHISETVSATGDLGGVDLCPVCDAVLRMVPGSYALAEVAGFLSSTLRVRIAVQ